MMTKATREMLDSGHSVDETDRIPDNIEITNFDLLMYVVAIVGHFVDMGVDINVATRYYLADKMVEFGFTVASILMPAIVNTAISVRMYAQDKQLKTQPDEFMKCRTLRIIMLVLLMASTMRVTDAFIWALKSRRAQRKRDLSSQRLYYRLMLKEDSDAALLRIFECFLEAAPQQLLQLTLLLRMDDQFTVHQVLAISSSIIGMGWALSSYQRAIRFAQQDKQNMNWVGSLLQILWHFLVSLSRITSLAMVAYLFPFWLLLAAATHILCMTAWLQCCDKSPFCAQSKLAELLFSVVLGTVYLFTYILPIDGRTRYRFAFYYTLCFLENIACAVLWYLYASEEVKETVFFVPVLAVSVVPFLVGMVLMVVYYAFVHPKVRKGAISDFSVSYKASGPMSVVNRDIIINS